MVAGVGPGVAADMWTDTGDVARFADLKTLPAPDLTTLALSLRTRRRPQAAE